MTRETLQEVKNVRYLGGSRIESQLSDFVDIANRYGNGQMTLWLRPDTNVSAGVWDIMIYNNVTIGIIPSE